MCTAQPVAKTFGVSELEQSRPCAQPVAKTQRLCGFNSRFRQNLSACVSMSVCLSLSAPPPLPPLSPIPFPISQTDVRMVAGFMSVSSYLSGDDAKAKVPGAVPR